MRTPALALLGLIGLGCDGGSEGGAIDAAVADAAVDAVACDLSFLTCESGMPPVLDRALCDEAVVLEPGAPRVDQDSAQGGFGECAVSASGVGGPSLYYRVVVPAGRIARVAVVPDAFDTPGLVRALDGCGVAASAYSSRGGTSSEGRAAVCIRNEDAAARSYVIAVSQYSGEFNCRPLRYDVSIELRGQGELCHEFE